MDFGYLENVDHVNFAVPEDDSLSLQFLKGRGHGLDIRFGAPSWAHKEWTDKVYPPKTKAADYLRWYSHYFTTIELNTTHYRIPDAAQVSKWAEQTPPTFQFCPKIFQGISHSPGGLLDKTLLKEWCTFLENLGTQRGPSFLQLGPSFTYNQKAELFEFLLRWPSEFELSIELRHPSWFRDGKILPALVRYLQGRGIGLVITDVAGRRDVVHTSISSDFVLLRFVCNDMHWSDEPRAHAWVERFVKWQEAGLRRLYLFIHQNHNTTVPELTQILAKRLREKGWDIDPQPPAEPQLALE